MQLSINKVKQSGENIVEIQGGSSVVRIYPESSISTHTPTSAANTIEVFTTLTRESRTMKTAHGNLLINSIGEFEQNEIFLSTHINGERATDDAELNLVEVEVEGVKVLYYNSPASLNREVLNELGAIHVLVLEVQENYEQQLKAISAIDPQILIPVASPKADLAKFKQELGIAFESQPKFKAKASDFQVEEYLLQGVEL